VPYHDLVPLHLCAAHVRKAAQAKQWGLPQCENCGRQGCSFRHPTDWNNGVKKGDLEDFCGKFNLSWAVPILLADESVVKKEESVVKKEGEEGE
jgi:hypothetical protein